MQAYLSLLLERWFDLFLSFSLFDDLSLLRSSLWLLSTSILSKWHAWSSNFCFQNTFLIYGIKCWLIRWLSDDWQCVNCEGRSPVKLRLLQTKRLHICFSSSITSCIVKSDVLLMLHEKRTSSPTLSQKHESCRMHHVYPIGAMLNTCTFRTWIIHEKSFQAIAKKC